MTKIVTARVSEDVLAMVDQLALSRERSRAWIVSRLIEQGAKKQLEMDAFIQVGLDDLEAGRSVPHDKVVEEILDRRKRRAAA